MNMLCMFTLVAGLNFCRLRVFAFLFSWFVTSPQTCCPSGLNFHGMKLSLVATNPAKTVKV